MSINDTVHRSEGMVNNTNYQSLIEINFNEAWLKW